MQSPNWMRLNISKKNQYECQSRCVLVSVWSAVPFAVPLACGKYFVNTLRAKQLSKFPCIMFRANCMKYSMLSWPLKHGNGSGPKAAETATGSGQRTTENGQRTADSEQRTTWQPLRGRRKVVARNNSRGLVGAAKHSKSRPSPRAQHAQMTEQWKPQGSKPRMQ